MGAIFYLVMDIAVHWGVYRHLRDDVGAKSTILISAMALDVVVLGAFLWMKATSDPLIILIAGFGIALIFVLEWLFLQKAREGEVRS